MKIRRVLSVVALAVTGLAAKAFVRRRRMVADLRKRKDEVTKMLNDSSLALRSIERELTYAGNPPGSGKASTTPTITLAELLALRDRVGALNCRAAEHPAQTGLLAFMQVKTALAKISAIEADASALTEEVQAFKYKVRLARDSGKRLP